MNAIAAGLDYAARLITGFLVTPFLVSGLGDTLYGVWKMLLNLTGYISAASGRPTQALKFTTANSLNSTDYDAKRRNVANAIIVWVIFLPILATLGGVVTWFVPTWIKDLPVNMYGIVRLSAGLLMADMIVTAITLLPQAVLEGENLAYKRMGMSATLVFVGAGSAILALYLGTGLVGVSVAELSTTLLTGIFFLWVVRNYVPWFGVARPSRQMVGKFLGLSSWFLVWRLVMQFMTASDLLILGMFASSKLVTVYSLTKYVPETLINIIAIVVFGSTPGLGGIIGSGDLKKASRLRGEIMMLTWLLTVIIGTTILLWNRAFINLWVGPSRFAGPTENLLILVLIAQFVLIRNDANIIDLTLKLSRKTILGIVSALLSIIAAVVLVKVFQAGILGLIIGLILGRLVLTLAYPIELGRFLGVSLPSQLKSALRPLLITALLFFLTVMVDLELSRYPSFSISWIGLVALVAITVPIVTLMAFFMGLTSSQRKQVLERIRIVISKTN